MRTTWHNLRGPSQATQLEQLEPWVDDMREFQRQINELYALIGTPACKQWQSENITLGEGQTWAERLKLVRAELIIRRGIVGEFQHQGARIAAELGIEVMECDCVLPEQSCDHCNPTKIGGRDPNDLPF